MKALIQCLLDWLNDNRSDLQAWRILDALARETIKVADSSDPAQREFDASDLAQACQPDRTWDYDAAKRWFTRANVPTFLNARRSELEAHYRAHGHAQALTLEQRKTSGRHRAPWFLREYELAAQDERSRGDHTDDDRPATGATTVPPDLIYEFTAPGKVKLNWIGRALLGQGSIMTKSARGLAWAGLVVASLFLVLSCAFVFWSMTFIRRPLMTSDLVLALLLIGLGWTFWRFLLRPLVWLLEDRIIPAGEFLSSWKEDPAQLDMAKDGKHRYIRLVRYGGVCPICAGTIELHYGIGENARRLFGCCSEAPQEHVFTFDRVTRWGSRYLRQ
jgi:hypothetical protein